MKIKLNKRIIFILIINILLILFGLLYPSIINKEIINNTVTKYINDLLESKYTINSIITNNIFNNLFENITIFISTILILLFPISIIIYFIKVFSIGVSISSILYIYKFKGLIYLLIIIIPNIINLIIYSILFYYSLSYFIIRIKYGNKSTKKRLFKGYLRVFIIVLISNTIISIINSYMTYYLFKLL